MNAKQTKNQSGAKCDFNPSLIALEKVEAPSLWSRIQKTFAPPDMTLDGWERLEMKRSRSSFVLVFHG